MGFNTTVNILNDGFDQLEKHPEQFVAAISRKMNDGGIAGVGIHVNMLQIAPARHADEFCLYAVHGNSLLSLTRYDKETRELAAYRPDLVRQAIELARQNLDDLEDYTDNLERGRS